MRRGRGADRRVIPRRPRPRAANPEPQIPAPRRNSAALRISYGGCEWCGKPTKACGGTSCDDCQIREQAHRQRMNALAEREAELRNQLLAQQLTDNTEESTTS